MAIWHYFNIAIWTIATTRTTNTTCTNRLQGVFHQPAASSPRLLRLRELRELASVDGFLLSSRLAGGHSSAQRPRLFTLRPVQSALLRPARKLQTTPTAQGCSAAPLTPAAVGCDTPPAQHAAPPRGGPERRCQRRSLPCVPAAVVGGHHAALFLHWQGEDTVAVSSTGRWRTTERAGCARLVVR
jgi:hypothetical protein